MEEKKPQIRCEIAVPVYSTYKRAPAQPLYLSVEVIEELYRQLSTQELAVGGILGMDAPLHVSHYYHDVQAQGEPNRYKPSARELERVADQWRRQGIRFCGFIHNHRSGHTRLSWSDRMFAREMLDINPRLPSIVIGLLAGKELVFYRFDRDYLDV